MIVHRAWHWWAGALLLVIVCVLGVAIGTVRLSVQQVYAALTGHASSSVHAIVVTLRLPRVVLAALVGLALGASGTTLQATLRKPLAIYQLLQTFATLDKAA